MASKRSLFSFDRRKKQVFLIIICIYTLCTFHLNNKRVKVRFQSRIDLPTTSHSEELDLKNYRPNQKKMQNLRDQLSFAFPYEPEKPMPRRIWQTWKVDVNSVDFPSDLKRCQKEWASQADAADLFQYSLVTDDHILPFLQNLYGEAPIVIEAFKTMPENILRADFLRYLLLFAKGGIYSDIDTTPLKPLDSWLSMDSSSLEKLRLETKPIPYKKFTKSSVASDPGFVIGIEADADRDDWKKWYARRIQFCQWTIQSKPGHPILRELILNITATTLNSMSSGMKKGVKDLIDPQYAKDYNVNFRDKRGQDDSYKHEALKTAKNIDGTDIMNWTGPGIFSDIVLNYMNNLINKHSDIALLNGNLESTQDVSKSTKKFYKKISESLQSGNEIPWEFFSLMDVPVAVDDVMVLPITSFSPGVEQMGAKAPSDEMAYVQHQFKGSWKLDADANREPKEQKQD